jgi:hypothetical protein
MASGGRWPGLRARWRHWRYWQTSSMPIELRQQRELERQRRKLERVHWRVYPVAGGHGNRNYPPKDQPLDRPERKARGWWHRRRSAGNSDEG